MTVPREVNTLGQWRDAGSQVLLVAVLLPSGNFLMACLTSTALESNIYYYGHIAENSNSGALARVSEAPHLLRIHPN